MKVRALTYFTSGVSDWSRDGVKRVVERGIDVLERAREAIEGTGVEVWTLRISLPEMPTDADFSRVAEAVLDSVDVAKYLVSLGGVYVGRASAREIAEACARGLYLPILGLWMDPPRWSSWVSKVLHEVAELSPEACTRLGAVLGVKPIETPYFPLSTSSRLEGLGVAYLYVDLVREHLEGRASVESISRRLSAVLEALRSSAAAKRVVADYSLSPWMESSVAELIGLMGCRVPELGTLYAIHRLNQLIEKVASLSGSAAGFNEVMLPYAEDSRLRELGASGSLSARHFLEMASACLAGIDMVVLPRDVEKLRGLILDAFAIARSKGRPLGLRAVPAAEEPGQLVDLGRFGAVAAISYE